MLDPEYLNSLPEPLIKLYEELEDWIIGDIAKRLKKYGEVTATAEHQTEILRALDLTQNEINEKIAETLNKSIEEIERLFDEAMQRSSAYTQERLPSLPTDGSFKKQLLENAITVSEGNLRNLTRTAGFITNFGKYSPLTTSYRDALSLASLQVSTGATDYNTAIRNTLKPFTDKGIVSITYDKDGKIRRRSIEAAVRQCVMQGARDMSKAYMQGVAGEIGADGWEISAHLNCAPDHQDCQGRQFSKKEFEEKNVPGGDFGRQIGTLNCRHMAFPIILGVSEPAHSEQELEELKAENDKGVTYEGKHYTLYEASQQQRKLERAIRKTKRELIVSEQYGDKDDFTAQSIRLRRLREYYNDFSNKCKLTKRSDLMTIGGKKKSGIVKRKEISEDSVVRHVLKDDSLKDISTEETVKETPEYKEPKVILEDVTDEYIKNAEPGNGTIIYEKGYVKEENIREIDIAKYLNKTFGGDIKLLTVSELPNEKTPDYEWRNRLWELKTVTTEKSANRGLREAVKQIKKNSGGVVFNYGENKIDLDKLKGVIIKRYYMSGKDPIDIMVVTNNKSKFIVWRIKK